MNYLIKESLKKVYLVLRKKFLSLFKFLFSEKVFDKSEIKKVLVIRIDRIGDVVLSTALLKTLKTNIPNAEISVLVSPSTKKILESQPYIDKIFTYEKKWNILRKLFFAINLRGNKYDLVIDTHYDYILETSLLTYIIGKKFRLGFAYAGREIFYNLIVDKIHTKENFIEFHNELLKKIGIKNFENKPYLFISEKEKIESEIFFSTLGVSQKDFIIFVHPGGYYPTQRWDKKNFVQLILNLIDLFKAKIFIIGNIKEKDIVEYIYNEITKKYKNNIFKIVNFPLNKLIALMSYAKIFIGNNSGPLHIACTLGIPTVSTMGPTNPYFWWPMGENNVVIRKDLSCSPCNKNFCKEHKCMDEISVSDVSSAVVYLVEKLKYRF